MNHYKRVWKDSSTLPNSGIANITTIGGLSTMKAVDVDAIEDGHVHFMVDESLRSDGTIEGRCETCRDLIVGRKIPGGLGTLTLKSVLVEAVGDAGFLPDLADELNRTEILLEIEENAIEDARKLITTAHKMLQAVFHLGVDEITDPGGPEES